MCHTWSLALLRATQASASRVTVVVSCSTSQLLWSAGSSASRVTVVVSCSTGQLLWSAGSSASRVTVVVSYSTGQLLWSAASAGSSASRVTAGSCRGHCWFTQGSLLVHAGVTAVSFTPHPLGHHACGTQGLLSFVFPSQSTRITEVKPL